MNPKQKFNELLVNKLIKSFEKRNMEAYYTQTKEDAKNKILSLIDKGSVITWGGSVSMEESNVISHLINNNYNCLDRSNVTPENVNDFYIDSFKADYYLMSTNAFTEDGELINIDGRGNRVAALAFGPKNIIIILSLNKMAKTREEAIARARNVAAPINSIRLKRNTPCVKTGVCHDCNVADCICANIVITRNSHIKNRIKIVLCEEDLGF